MRILVMSNLYDIMYNEISVSLIERKDDYDTIVLLGNIDIDTLKYIKSTLSENHISRQIIGVEGDNDIEGELELMGIKNIHMKSKSIEEKKFLGFSGAIKSNELNTHPTFTQSEEYELLDTLDKCDILISHSSPHGCEENIMESGFGVINDYIKSNKPQLCVHANKYVNSINLIEDTYVIGIHGIALVDLNDLTTTRLF